MDSLKLRLWKRLSRGLSYWAGIGSLATFIFFSDTASSQEDFFLQYSASLRDSTDLAVLADSIYATHSDPEKSLQLIRLYKRLAKANPDIPNRLQWVELLRGYRYNGIAWSNNRVDFAKAHRYLDSADMVFQSLDNENGLWMNTYGRASIHKNKGENGDALRLFRQYLAHYSDPFDSVYVANVQYQIGVVLQQMGKIDESTDAILASVRIDEALGRIQSAANGLNSIANGFKKIRRFDQAEAAYQRAWEIYHKHDNKGGQALVLVNYANLLSDLGKNDEALSKFLEAEQLSKADQNEHLWSHVLENLGNFYIATGETAKAKSYLERALALRKKYNSQRELYLIQIKIASLEQLLDNHTKALELLLPAHQTAVELKELENARRSAELLADSYHATNQYSEAYKFVKLGSSYQDSIINRDISNAVADMNTRYETEKKEQEIALLTAQNELKALESRQLRTIAIGAGTGMLILALFSWIIYSDRKKIWRLNNELYHSNEVISKSLEEKNILLKEIHHRVKNNLQVISSLLGIQSRKIKDSKAFEALTEGRARVNSMSLIHQDLYNQDNLKGIEMKSYLEKLVDSLFDTYNISDGDIVLESDIDPLTLDIDTVIPLGLIINELISNALKYAFPTGKGKITVKLKQTDRGLLLDVSDNGIGMDNPDQVVHGDTFGYDLISALVDKLDGSLSIEVNAGTRVHAVLKTYQVAA